MELREGRKVGKRGNCSDLEPISSCPLNPWQDTGKSHSVSAPGLAYPPPLRPFPLVLAPTPTYRPLQDPNTLYLAIASMPMTMVLVLALAIMSSAREWETSRIGLLERSEKELISRLSGLQGQESTKYRLV